jgi:ABC-type phosphate transport system substrate-binding protein
LSKLRPAVRIGIGVTTAAMSVLAMSGVATADPDPITPSNYPTTTAGQYPTGKTDAQLLAGVGADADAELLDRIAAGYDGSSNPAPDPLLTSYDAINPISGAAGDTITTKPGCSFARPNGANAGITALINGVHPVNSGVTDSSDYCVDWARSSRPKGTATAEQSLTFWEFAPDAVDWVTVGNSYAPPTPLTLAQLHDIFTCAITDWSQVGGQPGEIHVYEPPTTAGTYTFFLSAIGSSTAEVGGDGCVPPDPAHSITGNSRVFSTQQNDGTRLLADPQGIAPYAVSKWAGQKNASDLGVTGINDVRGGTVLGHWVNDTEPTTTYSLNSSFYTVLNQPFAFTTGQSRPGRYLYNVTRGTSQTNDLPAWAAGLFGNTGYICSNAESLLVPFGTYPLSNTVGNNTGHWCGEQF